MCFPWWPRTHTYMSDSAVNFHKTAITLTASNTLEYSPVQTYFQCWLQPPNLSHDPQVLKKHPLYGTCHQRAALKSSHEDVTEQSWHVTSEGLPSCAPPPTRLDRLFASLLLSGLREGEERTSGEDGREPQKRKSHHHTWSPNSSLRLVNRYSYP